ncbi:type VII secretion system-associated protein [Kitasatospora sp. NPDC049285]|uniref:type VII secretion system-associated protein n=1 Tax=Kitasatospora sp. NPDC049285 TaxID=3157096 RepID=UPI0034257AAB
MAEVDQAAAEERVGGPASAAGPPELAGDAADPAGTDTEQPPAEQPPAEPGGEAQDGLAQDGVAQDGVAQDGVAQDGVSETAGDGAADGAQDAAAPAHVPVGLDSVPDYIRVAAKHSPGQWVGLVDPTWHGDGPPPAWAVIGEWRADDEGELAEFRENEEYRASPMSHEWPAPTDPIDAAVQLSATGYGPPEDVMTAVRKGPLGVAVDDDGAIAVVELPDGEPAVLVYSSDAQVTAAGDPPYAAIGIEELAALLPEGYGIVLNSAAPVGMRLDPADFLPEQEDEPAADPASAEQTGTEQTGTEQTGTEQAEEPAASAESAEETAAGSDAPPGDVEAVGVPSAADAAVRPATADEVVSALLGTRTG